MVPPAAHAAWSPVRSSFPSSLVTLSPVVAAVFSASVVTSWWCCAVALLPRSCAVAAARALCWWFCHCNSCYSAQWWRRGCCIVSELDCVVCQSFGRMR